MGRQAQAERKRKNGVSTMIAEQLVIFGGAFLVMFQVFAIILEESRNTPWQIQELCYNGSITTNDNLKGYNYEKIWFL